MILVDIGEVGVHAGDQSCVLRPSLYAMTLLGDPRDIVQAYGAVMAPDREGSLSFASQRRTAMGVLTACARDEDLQLLHEVFGHWQDDGKFAPGTEAWPAPLHLARCLMRHGVTGALPPLPRRADQDQEFVQEFDARQHVALAMAHLGIGEREAWAMTMTSLVAALRAKFPPSESDAPGARAPSAEDHDLTMEWFEQIDMKRKAAQRLH